MLLTKRFPIMACVFISTLCALTALSADEIDTKADPTSGPWIERSDGRFRFVYKKADEVVAGKYLAVSEEAYRIVTGYMQLEPKEKPVVILYGSMDSPPFGAVTAAFPMRIGIEAQQTQLQSPKTLLVHEFTHYMQMSQKKSGLLGKLAALFAPDMQKQMTALMSDLSLEGSTSFIDGTRRSDLHSLPVRAAVLEGQMWDYDKVRVGGLRYPKQLRTYLSQMLVQDWLFDSCGDDALLRILDRREKSVFSFESAAFGKYSGVDFKTAWGDIRAALEKRYAFARSLPLGEQLTPRDSGSEPQWGILFPTQEGFLMFRSDLKKADQLGFWRPDISDEGGDKKKNPGLLEPDRGSFAPLEGAFFKDFTVDAQASKIAGIVTNPEDTGLSHDRNASRLFLADIEWNADHSEARAIKARKLPGSGFASPCLSPDGTRLFGAVRVSDSYRAVEIDMSTGVATALSIPSELSVASIAISPDGGRLAFTLVSNGEYDVGVYDLGAGVFSLLTRDAASDYAARFLSDGSFVFSSDRENTIMVYRYADGTFSREIVDAIAATHPVEDGDGGYYYSSYSAFGKVIRHLRADQLAKAEVPEFSQARPDWIARRDHIWEHYSKKGEDLAAAHSRKKTGGEISEKPFIDIALPVIWFPQVSYGLEGLGLGASLAAMSYLGENSYQTTLRYYPSARQLDGSFNLALSFPFMSIDLGLGQSYSGAWDQDSVATYSLTRFATLGADLPIFAGRSSSRIDSRFAASIDTAYSENATSQSQISLSRGFDLVPERSVSALPGIEGSIAWPDTQTAMFGGSYVKAGAHGLVEWNSGRDLPGFGAIANLGTGILLGSSLISLSGKAAYRGYGGAQELVPRAVKRWESDSGSPWFAEAGISWSHSTLFKEKIDGCMLREQEGTVLSLKTFWEADEPFAPRFNPEIELGFEYTMPMILYYNPLPFSIGAAYRFQYDRESLDRGFDPADLCFKISVAGISFSR